MREWASIFISWIGGNEYQFVRITLFGLVIGIVSVVALLWWILGGGLRRYRSGSQ